jgi:protein-S-isoprenylcysteine O-methyltransferase Ste14
MRPLPFVWPYALIFWAVYIWAFLPEMKIVRGGLEGGKHADSKDSSSMKVLLAGMGLASFIAYPIAFVKAWSFPQSWHVPLFAVGVLLMILGSLLRRFCWRTLGEYFTGDVTVKPDQAIISSGPYRLLRHPSYTAGMMMYIGMGLALGSWFSLALLTISTYATYSYRVIVEERVLLDALGEPYAAYMKERKRFIPFVL